jgi:hypothetical protein
MASYVTREQIAVKIPPNVLLDALDDNADGQEDAGVFDAVVASASEEVDGYLSGLYTVPFTEPFPPKVAQAALALACSLIYERRQVEFPEWLAASVKFWRSHLERVGNREIPFDAAQVKAFSPGAALASPMSIDAQST